MIGCCKAMVDQLVPLLVKVHSSQPEWLKISKTFEKRWDFPHAFGAIDGKHVIIRKPSNYYNYKHTHSIILLAIAGPDYECLYLDVGSNGRYSGVWNKSSLLQAV